MTIKLQWVEEKSFLEEELRKSEKKMTLMNEKYNEVVEKKDYYEL
jgi:hypothetical protein